MPVLYLLGGCLKRANDVDAPLDSAKAHLGRGVANTLQGSLLY
ncbi:MAG: hypothetical protein Fur0021_07790 [Candidatus Promineifilaceae bacterium]